MKRTPFLNERKEKMYNVLAAFGIFLSVWLIMMSTTKKLTPCSFVVSLPLHPRLPIWVSVIFSTLRSLLHPRYPIRSFTFCSVISTNPSLLRNVLTEKYNINDYHESEFMFNSFHDGLLHAINCNNLGLLTLPPQTYYAIFPKSTTKPKPKDNNNINKEIPDIKDLVC